MSELSRHQPEGRRRYRVGGSGAASGVDGGPIGHVEDLLPAYALGALDPDERASVERHLRVCSSCAALAAENARTVGMLPFALTSVRPSPVVKAALFARIAHTERAIAEAAPGPRPAATVYPLPPTLTIPASRPAAAVAADATPHPGVRPASRFGWVATALSAPLLIGLIATGLWGMQLRGQISQQAARADALEAELANFGSAADADIYNLSPTDSAPQAEGRLVVGADQRRGVVNVDLNTQRPGNRDLEVWAVKGGNLVPLAKVKVDEKGQGSATFALDQPFTEYESVHVKPEPIAGNGSPDADGEDVLSGVVPESIGSSDSGSDAIP